MGASPHETYDLRVFFNPLCTQFHRTREILVSQVCLSDLIRIRESIAPSKSRDVAKDFCKTLYTYDYAAPMNRPSAEFLDSLMHEALIEAAKASAAGEVPVGAVIAHNGSILSRAHNTTETDATVLAHAEIHAITRASQALGGWRLSECILCVTLEPCTMCLGAIRLARIPTLVFGAGDSRQGAVGSLYDLSQDERLGSPLRVISGIKKVECEASLVDFFKSRRKS